MTEHDASEMLFGEELMPLIQGPIAEIKRIISDCLDAEIPALGGMPPSAGKG